MPYKDPEKHKAHCREYNRRMRLEHPKKIKQYRIKWKKKYPGRYLEVSRRWRQSNLQKGREASTKWRLNHPDRYRETSRRRSQTIKGRYLTCKKGHKKRGLEFNITLEEYTAKDLINICGFCGKPFDRTIKMERVWEYDYEEFWHRLCNVFKGRMNRDEFERFLLRCIERLSHR